ncbi:TOM1-like protein 5 isoform X2 [Diospyros lotus]|uniref:TOM1-like protein 5 isoform X2 n=1 Tax=Diospyros lotus TaxID=55363 RepID=UPI002253724C|nr:TOM1-like protein 5 isoform X2 [Diospyros lotus]XP_052188849.1 TOM1-like protein 5 isoform X2 [Diospyros lotus]
MGGQGKDRGENQWLRQHFQTRTTCWLLEMLMNNIGDHVHRHVIDLGLLPILVKIVKKKSDSPVREKIFLLLDATQTSLGGVSGKFPQYYNAYYDLVTSGVQFPRRPHVTPPNFPTSNVNVNGSIDKEVAPPRQQRPPAKAEPQNVPESSIIQKAGSAMEVLREVLDAVNTQHPEGATDEFTLDLVEQCSFQKQRVMHLAMTSRDEAVVSRAIELNEQLQKVLARHDMLVSRRPTSSNHFVQEEEEEEEAEQLSQRIRKGKACVRPEDEERQKERPWDLFGSLSPREKLHRPLIRPLSVEPSQESNKICPASALPPPPAKHVERQKFFQEKRMDGPNLAGHFRGLSLDGCSGHSGHARGLSLDGSGPRHSSLQGGIGSGSYGGSIDSD